MPPKRLTLAILASIVLAPFLSVQIPALGDTLNHLARMHVLATLRHAPDLQRFYTIHWAPIPYLAMDAIVPGLARVLPIYVAGKIFVCACVLMPTLGTLSLHYAVHRRVSLVPAAAFLLCTNYLLALGFLNYLFSAGAAVMLFAGWYAAASWNRWRRALAFAPLVLLLYLGHAFACLAYCLAVAGLEGSRALRWGWVGVGKQGQGLCPRTPTRASGPGPLSSRTARRGHAPSWPALATPTHPQSGVRDVLAAAAQAVPALGFAATLHVSGGYVGALSNSYGNPLVKLMAAASPMLFLIDPVNILSIAVVLGLGVVVARHLRVSPAIWPAVLVVVVAAIAMPHVAASTWGMDLRLPIVAVMLLIGGMSWAGTAAARWPVLAVLAALLLARSADAWGVLHRVDAEVAEHRRILSLLPPGARLLVVNAAGPGTGLERVTSSTQWHMPLVAVIDRDAFVPYIFSGLTTIQVNPAFRLSSTPNGLPISLEQLRAGAAAADDGVEHGDGQGARLYFRGWPGKFDYVLIQAQSDDIGAVPAVLAPVAHGPGLGLYRVVGRQ